MVGQVHRTRLKWREVVVKVQRPGLKALFDIDLKNLRLREGGRQEKVYIHTRICMEM